MYKRYWLLFVLSFLLNACFFFSQSPQTPEKLLDPDPGWVEIIFNQMNIDQKIGQMIFIRSNEPIYSDSDPGYKKLKDMVQRYQVGGMIISQGNAFQRIPFFNQIQSIARVPLIFAADFERGTGEKIDGGTEFISAMGVGATGDPQNAYDTGRITALEARAMGYHMTFSPVVDINTNPKNPVINIRSYSDNPQSVTDFSQAYIKGVQENGLLATAKHFPGHGKTAVDSHKELPKIMNTSQDLQQVELVPFMEAVKNNITAIMTGHIALPNYDKDFVRPATLSPFIVDDLLRKKLRFNGLVISDAFEMGAIKDNYYEGTAAVKAIKSGVDIILIPTNIRATFFAIRQAIQNRTISMQMIDESVKRILHWKSVLGLNSQPLTNPESLMRKLRNPVFLSTAQKISRQAITLVKNEELPLRYNNNSIFHYLNFADDSGNNPLDNEFLKTLGRYLSKIGYDQIDPQFELSSLDTIIGRMQSADYIINSYHFGPGHNPTANQSELIQRLIKSGKPIINVFFGSPYLSMDYPDSKNILFAYSNDPYTQQAAAEAVAGKIPISGKLPVSIPDIAGRGTGVDLPRYDRVLAPSDYRSDLPFPVYLDSLKTYLNEAIADSAFPGCAISVGYRGDLILQESFGNFTYDQRSKKVQPNSIFDLASLTKVVATTTITMMLYDRDLLQLEWRISDIIPAFQGKNKDQVTIRHLLTHTSGLPGWIKFYLAISGKERIVQEICATDLIYPPGTKSVYSDLGMILMQKIIETIAQKPLDLLVKENISDPLGMERTFYSPDQSWLNDIVPTEYSEWRKALVRGFVHDENTYAMGGISGHAGLFSTTEDLAVFCQMYLNGGSYDYRRLLDQETIDLFTARQNLVEGSTRSLGWDTRSEQSSMSGDFMSMRAYGHSGFTGTTIWIDPDNEVFVVFLTNRVHPTRKNNKIREVRPRVHNYVMKAILGSKE